MGDERPALDPSLPHVTVAVTTHDRPMLARRAVESVLNQTFRDLEVIVVDDGSTGPVSIPADPRIRAIRLESPRGVCAARNIAVRSARGTWITFLDDDDQLEPDTLEVSLAAAQTSSLPPPVAVLTAIAVVRDDGSLLETRVPPTLPRGADFSLEEIPRGRSFQTQNTLMAPLSVICDIGGWDEALRAMEHDDFFLRLNAAASIQGLDSVGYRLTAHEGTRLSRDLEARADGMARVIARNPDAFARHPHRYAEYLGVMGITCLRAGRWKAALAATTRALRIDPRAPKALRRWGVSLAGPWAWRSFHAVGRRLSAGSGHPKPGSIAGQDAGAP